MTRRLPDTNLPAGVSSADPHFYDEEPPCACGHVADEHEPDGLGVCVVEDCDCVAYEAVCEDV